MVPLVVAAPLVAAVSFGERKATTAAEKASVAPEPAKRVFTPEEVKSLNAFQRAGVRHPYTCGWDHRDANHLDGEGVLLATERGWICLYCDYTQEWASSSMKNWRWKEIHWRELEGIRRERRR
ncbi:MAG: hypothetical protein ACHP78_00360 [Terriglobales bacterium]